MSNTTTAPTRIPIVDDHPIIQQGYAQLVGMQPDLEVCATAASGREALAQVEVASPQLAVVDVSLQDMSGIELVKEMRACYGHVKILVISAHDENLYAERALEAGALGYIGKREAIGNLVEAIRTVLDDEVYVSEQIKRRWLKRRVQSDKQIGESPAIDALTDRELQVYELTGHGQSTKQIAARLHLSPKTIERYKENIKQKLELKNSTELVQQATRWVLEGG